MGEEDMSRFLAGDLCEVPQFGRCRSLTDCFGSLRLSGTGVLGLNRPPFVVELWTLSCPAYGQ